jgi:hypothetical protein
VGGAADEKVASRGGKIASPGGHRAPSTSGIARIIRTVQTIRSAIHRWQSTLTGDSDRRLGARRSLVIGTVGAWPANITRLAWWTRFAWWCDGTRRFGIGLRSAAVFPLDCFVNFLSVNGNRLGCVNSQPHFVASNINNRYDNVVADHDAFVTVSRKDQHGALFNFLECGPGCKERATPTPETKTLASSLCGDHLDTKVYRTIDAQNDNYRSKYHFVRS